MPLDNLPDDAGPIPLDSDELQLRTDVANVVEGRVNIATFPEEYQNKIRYFYQFFGIRYESETPVVAKRIRQTLDIV